MSCTLFINACLASLSDTERRLAEYVLANPQSVMHMNAKQFAQACGSSPAAVVRFSKRLGFQGFTALKLDLARESALPAPDAFQSAIRESDDLSTIIQKAESIHQRNIALTYRMVNADVLSGAIGALGEGRSVRLYGVGASGLLAMDFLYKGSRVGMRVFYHADAHTNLATASLLGPQDVAIAISYSGRTRETVLAAQAARDHGAKVIAITQANRNALSRLADFPLYVPSEESELRVGAMTSRVSGQLILDLLYLGYARCHPERAEECLLSTRELIRGLQGK